MENISENTNWYIEITEENTDSVHKWYNKHWPKSLLEEGNLAGVYKNRNGKFQVGMLDSIKSDKKADTYDFGNEISFNDFKKYILKEDVFPENWCLKITKDNYPYISEKRLQGLTVDYGFIHSKLNSDRKNFWCWAEHILFDSIEITLDDFKKHVMLETTIRGYPTSLETVKFKSDPDKCVGKRPIYIPDNFGVMGATQKSVDAFEDLRRTIDEKIIDSRPKIVYWGTGGSFGGDSAEEVFKDPYKWEELPKKMLTQTAMYDLMSKDLTSTFEIMSKLSSEFPITPKDSFKAPSDMIYVKKLKTFLK